MTILPHLLLTTVGVQVLGLSEGDLDLRAVRRVEYCARIPADFAFCIKLVFVSDSMGRESDGFLRIPIVVAHEKLGLSPNGISTIGFVVGIAAAVLVAAGLLLPGLIVMALSQIIDGLDGGVVRRSNLQSP